MEDSILQKMDAEELRDYAYRLQLLAYDRDRLYDLTDELVLHMSEIIDIQREMILAKAKLTRDVNDSVHIDNALRDKYTLTFMPVEDVS